MKLCRKWLCSKGLWCWMWTLTSLCCWRGTKWNSVHFEEHTVYSSEFIFPTVFMDIISIIMNVILNDWNGCDWLVLTCLPEIKHSITYEKYFALVCLKFPDFVFLSFVYICLFFILPLFFQCHCQCMYWDNWLLWIAYFCDCVLLCKDFYFHACNIHVYTMPSAYNSIAFAIYIYQSVLQIMCPFLHVGYS